jgi:hypothetical protein
MLSTRPRASSPGSTPWYFAENVATFAIVMGFALLITGGGFLVLTIRVLRRLGGAREDRPAASGQVALSS